MIEIFLILVFAAFLFLFSRINALQKQLDELKERVESTPPSQPVEAVVRSETAGEGERWQPSPEEAPEERSPQPWPAAPVAEAAPPPVASIPSQSAHEAPAEPVSYDWGDTQKPSGPGVFDKLLGVVKGYFTEGNLIVRVGVIVLFFGVAFLLQYANEQGVLPVRLKIFGVALLGLVLLAVGWVLREKRTLYGLIMQGGGLGILYMTVFAALRLFQVLSPGLTMALLVAMVVVSAALALLQNAPALAVMAATGGFLAPILTSSGSGSHVALFAYYAVLNLGIFGIAWFKAWRALNLVGFLFTFVIGTLWGVLEYRPDQFASTESFLILFFLFYVAIALLFASRQPPRLKGYVDGTLVFGVPIVSFGLQACLVVDFEYGLAWSALALGLFYGALAAFCLRRDPRYRLLGEAYLALGVVFGSLTIPFALEGEWISTAWALEGAALVWLGVRQQRRLGVVFAILLQLAAGFVFLGEFHYRVGAPPVLNATFISALFLALGGLVSSYCLYRFEWEAERWGLWVRRLLLLWGMVWWVGNGFQEIDHYLPLFEWAAVLLFIAATGAALGWLEARLSWHSLRYYPVGMAIALGLLAAGALVTLPHPFAEYSLIGWVALFGVYGLALRQRDNRVDTGVGDMLPALHALGIWALVALLGVECYWWAGSWTQPGSAWALAAAPLPVLAAVWAVLRHSGWPVAGRVAMYRVNILAPLAGALVLWFLAVGTQPGVGLITYLPVLNPLGLVQLGVLFTLLIWCRTVVEEQRLGMTPTAYRAGLSALAFVGLNVVVLRSLHHWTGVAYDAEAIWASAQAQATLSIVWTLVGLGTMVVATRRGWRPVWLVAAVLLGVVVAKLFLFDMRDSDTLSAIVSFIAVGLLLLLVGYLSPLPPREKNA